MASDTPVAEVSNLRMYSAFWQNLHHFLYAFAWAARAVPPGTRPLAMPLPPGSDVPMTPEKKATWDKAVAVYAREFASKDLLFDRGMTMIKLGLSDRDDALTDAPFDDELKLLLISARRSTGSTGGRCMMPPIAHGLKTRCAGRDNMRRRSSRG